MTNAYYRVWSILRTYFCWVLQRILRNQHILLFSQNTLPQNFNKNQPIDSTPLSICLIGDGTHRESDDESGIGYPALSRWFCDSSWRLSVDSTNIFTLPLMLG